MELTVKDIHIEENTPDGEYIKLWSNGNVEIKGNIVNHKKEGVFNYYYEDGSRNAVVFFNDDLMEGMHHHWHKNKLLQAEMFYINGKKTGICKIFHENGNLKNESEFKDDMLNGIVKTYYPNGVLESICSYKENKKEGLYQSFHQNGNKEIECYFINDKTEGV